MCEVVAYMVGRSSAAVAAAGDGAAAAAAKEPKEPKELMKDVALVEQGSGEVTLRDILGRTTTYAARVRTIDLLGHRLYLEPL